jgi:hypothetical protein
MREGIDGAEERREKVSDQEAVGGGGEGEMQTGRLASTEVHGRMHLAARQAPPQERVQRACTQRFRWSRLELQHDRPRLLASTHIQQVWLNGRGKSGGPRGERRCPSRS